MYSIAKLERSRDGYREAASFLRDMFPEAGHIDADYLAWLYGQNPDGPGVTLNAYHEGRLIGHVAFLELRARLDGKARRGTVTVQWAVQRRPERKCASPSFAFWRQYQELASEMGYHFNMGITNADSTPVAVRRMGYHLVGPLDVRVGLGRAPTGDTGRSEGAGFERLWSEDAIRWRLDRPGRPYGIVRDGDLALIYGPTHRFGIWVEMARFPMDLLPADVPALRSINPVRLWVGMDPATRRSVRYATLPERLRPVPLNFLFIDLKDEDRIPGADTARIRAFDFNAF